MPSEPNDPLEPHDVPGVDDEGITPDSLSLEEEKRFQQKGKSWRAGQREAVLHWVSLAVLGALGLTAFGVILIRAWHLLAPSNMRWLSAQDLDTVDNVVKLVASGGIGAGVWEYARKLFPNS